MTDKIFLIQPDKTLQELEEQPYDREDLLQKLLKAYPDLLAGHQMNESAPRRWLLVAREMGIPGEPDASNRWSLDHLFLDQDGIPTLVEVKRASDTRIRREVVGQMLDYAANAVLHWPLDVIRRQFEKTCADAGTDPVESVAGLIETTLDNEEAVESFWQTVYRNLRAGKLRLLFVADHIPAKLRRIIEFMNAHMQEVEVLGVELPQYVGFGLTTIVPRVVGQTAAAEQAKGMRDSGRQWDEVSFFAELTRLTSAIDVVVAQRILAWTKGKNLQVQWGQGKEKGTFVPIIDLTGIGYRLFAVYTSGKIEFYFKSYLGKTPFNDAETRSQLMNRLNAVSSLQLEPTNMIRNLHCSLDTFGDAADQEALLSAYDWYLDEVRRTKTSEVLETSEV